MHKLVPFAVIFVVAFKLIAQPATNKQPQLSANLQQWLNKSNAFSSQFNGLVLAKQQGILYVSALVKVATTINEKSLSQLEVLVGTKAGNIWTVQIPITQIKNFIKLKDIEYIQLDEPIVANLDIARKSSKVDSVQNGLGLPLGYSGKNVVVGIIDAGFDYSHPSFYDTSGNVLRVKKVWEQKNVGTPPAGYAYGNELVDTTSMLNKGTEVSTFSHGTHVGGIAAGSGYGSLNNKKYRGVAYESDLVFVGIRPEKSEWKSMGMASIIDGVNYIFNYAQSVGKPAVVNLSWGCSIGPNDGSSLFSQAIDNLTGPGKIFVLSAGNNGEENIHLQKQFSAVDTIVHTFVTFPNVSGEQRSWIDIWGDTAQTFCIKTSLYNANNVSDSIAFLCINNTTTDTFLIGNNNDTCFFSLTSTAADFNGRPHILLDVWSKTPDKFCISLTAKSGNLHMWQGYVKDYTGYDGAFTNNGMTWATNGNNAYTLGEMSCTRTAITVAAYASKTGFRNLAGSNISYSGYVNSNQIVPFSSHGPTTDGRIKPDVAAPGMTLASSVNSYDVSYAPAGSNYAQSVTKYTSPKNNINYYYAEASGTSMSAPMMSGITALLLQINPLLSPHQLKDILKQTATRDNFTTQNPDSARWGVGKVNAYAAIKRTLLTAKLKGQAKLPFQDIRLYPNPSKGDFYVSIVSPIHTNMIIEVVNYLGQVISSQPWHVSIGDNQLNLSLNNSTKGIYFVNLIGNGQQQVRKLVLY